MAVGLRRATRAEAAGENAEAAAPWPRRAAHSSRVSVGQDEQQRGDGEGDQAAEQDRAGADAVGQGAEDGFEEDLGAVVQGEQAAEHEQGVVVAGGEVAEVGGDAVGAEGGGEPGRVQRPQPPIARRIARLGGGMDPDALVAVESLGLSPVLIRLRRSSAGGGSRGRRRTHTARWRRHG